MNGKALFAHRFGQGLFGQASRSIERAKHPGITHHALSVLICELLSEAPKEVVDQTIEVLAHDDVNGRAHWAVLCAMVELQSMQKTAGWLGLHMRMSLTLHKLRRSAKHVASGQAKRPALVERVMGDIEEAA